MIVDSSSLLLPVRGGGQSAGDFLGLDAANVTDLKAPDQYWSAGLGAYNVVGRLLFDAMEG
jgi:hypothetical protein